MRKKGKRYFTQETEDAIVLYNNTEDLAVKSQIYEKNIHQPFLKLTENIIHTFKFYHTEVDDLFHLQHEVIVFLLSKIHLYDQSRGTRAFSYFQTIVKRYLINKNKEIYKKKIESISINSGNNSFEEKNQNQNSKKLLPHQFVVNEEKQIETDELKGANNHDRLAYFMDLYVEYCTHNLERLFRNETDIKIADAILELFRKRESLDIFNKKALYIYIREIIDARAPKITKVSNQLHTVFKSKYEFFNENGYFEN